MQTKRKLLFVGGTVIGIVVALTIAVGHSGTKPKVCGFQGADPDFTPLFVKTTQGHPEVVKVGVGTNAPQVEYVHRCYTLADRVQLIGVMRYQIGRITKSLGLNGWAEETRVRSCFMKRNTTVLWVGYRAKDKENVPFLEPVLIS